MHHEGVAQTGAFGPLAASLVEMGREFHARGWALGTSGNLSCVVGRDPLLVAITGSGLDKSRLDPSQILLVDGEGRAIAGSGRPSDETPLHLTLVKRQGAGAVVHTHSVWATILSEAHGSEGQLRLSGYEMLKGLKGVRTHEHSEPLPILDNSQDYASLTSSVESALSRHPTAHGFLLRRHGLYTWGEDLAEARRHVEILEFLLEVAGRTRALPREARDGDPQDP